MATKSADLRSSQADNLVANLDRLDLEDAGGNVLATGNVTWGSASNGAVAISATIELTGASAAGSGTAATAARLYHSGESGEEIDGLTVTGSGGGGDIELDNVSIAEGQAVTITSLTITEPAETA